jgi:hypothetical protein
MNSNGFNPPGPPQLPWFTRLKNFLGSRLIIALQVVILLFIIISYALGDHGFISTVVFFVKVAIICLTIYKAITKYHELEQCKFERKWYKSQFEKTINTSVPNITGTQNITSAPIKVE